VSRSNQIDEGLALFTGALGEEHLEDRPSARPYARVPANCGMPERRSPKLQVLGIRVGSLVEEQPDQIDVALLGRNVERSDATVGLRVDVRPLRQQRSGRRNVSLSRSVQQLRVEGERLLFGLCGEEREHKRTGQRTAARLVCHMLARQPALRELLAHSGRPAERQVARDNERTLGRRACPSRHWVGCGSAHPSFS